MNCINVAEILTIMQLKKQFLVTCTMLLCFTASLLAQDKKITGKVHTATGVGIAGASVIGKTSKRGTATDNAGNFTITASQNDNVLVISSLGFLSQEIAITGKSDLDITLVEDPRQLTDVVVTALGIKKETKRLGYATTLVKGSDLTKARDVNALQSLTGKVAGLTIGASAEMLARPQIVLRGSTDLLFVVDGVPINSDTWNISADDIETYNVLKGPNAAALYGFRGINGAIIVTTKRGSKEKKGWQVDFNTSDMIEHGFITEPQSQTEYGRGTKYVYSYGDRLYDNSQRLQEYGPRFEGQLIKQYDSPFDPTTGIRTATPWLARGANNFHKFMETGLLSTNNVSLSASGDKYDVRMSYSHTYQKGTAPNTRLNVDNVNLNAGYNLTSKLRVEGNMNLNLQYSPNIPDVSYGPNSYIYMFKVYGSSDYNIDDLKNIYKGPQGVNNLVQYAPEYGRENSAWFIADKWLRSHNKTDIYAYLKLNYKVTPNLDLSVRSQVTTWNQTRTEQVPASTNLNTYLPWYYFGWYGDYRVDQRNLLENNTDFLASYTKKIGGWDISANAGASERSLSFNSFWGTTKDLAIPNVYTLSNSINAPLSYTYSGRMQVYSGYYNFDFGYKKFFNVSTTGRVDNLSTLSAGNNTFFYPSVSTSSVLSDYLDLPKAVSFLKLRASYADVKGGLTSTTIPSAYAAITGSTTGALLGYGTDLYTSYDGPTYQNQNTYNYASYYNGTSSVNYSNTIANPALKPYNVQSFEAGIDARFLKNRMGFDVTYFTSINGPLIYQLGVAPSTGFYGQNVNGITSLKKGIEIAFNASPIKNPNGFSWDVNLNWSTYKETLKDIYGSEQTLFLNGHNYKVGDRLDNLYSTKFVRDGSGNIVYSGGNPIQAPSQSDNSNLGLIGHLNPDFTFGASNRVSYKNFSLSFQFDGRIGGKIYDRVLYQGNNGGTSLESASGDFGVARYNDWVVAKNNGGTLPSTYAGSYVGKGVVITAGTPHYTNGQIDNLSSLTFATNATPTTVQGYLSSGIGANFDEYYYVDRSFVKLREVTLSYALPAKLLNNKKIKAVTFSLVGRNLLYFAARKDFDIEQYASGFNVADRSAGGTSSTDLQSATSRRYGVNINVSF
jgi:TonB-linked SusC/RagA family outer membrane protein